MNIRPLASTQVPETNPVPPASQGWASWIAESILTIPSAAASTVQLVASSGLAVGRVVVSTGSSVVIGAYNRVYGAAPAVSVRSAEAEDAVRQPALRGRSQRPQQHIRAASAAPRAVASAQRPRVRNVRQATAAGAPLRSRPDQISATFQLSIMQKVLVLDNLQGIQLKPGSILMQNSGLSLANHQAGLLADRILSELTTLDPTLYKATIYNSKGEALDRISMMCKSIEVNRKLVGFIFVPVDFKCVFERI